MFTYTPKSEIDPRIRNFQAQMKAAGTDGALILQNTDLFYFAGTIQQSQLYVPADGLPILMVKKNFERACQESRLDRIVPIVSPRQIPEILSHHGYAMPKILGMELDVLPAALYLNFCKIFESSKITDISHPIRMVRSIKSEHEIALIREACRLSDAMFACIGSLIREGVSEVALSGEIEAIARKSGSQGIVRMRLWGSELFYGHFMSGAAAAMPSYLSSPTGGMGTSPATAQGASLKKISKHEPILADYTFAYQGYISDQTRIFSLGSLSDDLLRAHDAMLSVQETVKTHAKPGADVGELYEIAVAHVKKSGYDDNFMGVGDDRIRFIGHGVGLELDEYPFLAKGQTMRLEKNMTIAIEPKLIFPGRGVVGIENTYLVNDDGLEQLTRFEENVIAV
ncbi:MAG: aminopeptidase P family protein [Desulfobacteraceae bacterium]|nr:aminopeptidase P family protein [Desulfobacteraceae bacterium]